MSTPFIRLEQIHLEASHVPFYVARSMLASVWKSESCPCIETGRVCGLISHPPLILLIACGAYR